MNLSIKRLKVVTWGILIAQSKPQIPLILLLMPWVAMLQSRPATAQNFAHLTGEATGHSIPGVYGTKGIPDAANGPGVRHGAARWTDSAGNIWLFGGAGYGASSARYMNDLWKYDVASGVWTWTDGGDESKLYGMYGTQGVAEIGNIPGPRANAASWTDSSGNLWLFGGYGYAALSTGSLSQGRLNDLWKYEVSSGLWTWIKGSDTKSQLGTYGARGATASENTPGARENAAFCTDKQGNLWLLGGQGFDKTHSGFLNDVWMYDVADGNWIWVSGSDTVNEGGSYGSQGVPATSNMPGARYCSASWFDSVGNLWVFGGHWGNLSYGYFNDLWKYEVSTDAWTWMKGSNGPNQLGVYGTMGVAATSNFPGARSGAVYWTDSVGNLLLFGGQGSSATPPKEDQFNDIWKYDVVSGNWSWVGGSHLPNQFGIYGTKGIPATGNVPGARAQPAGWADNLGNFWLFGGNGFTASSFGDLNDLWKYNASEGSWAWFTGSSGVIQVGTYGTQGVAASGNTPGARYGPVSWTDNAGNYWVYGGYGYGTDAAQLGYLNDLWKFNAPTGEWEWVNGSTQVNQAGTYGTQGVAEGANFPGGRYLATSWTDSAGNLWLFGGYGYGSSNWIPGFLSDLWKYDVTSGNWTYMKGTSFINQPGSYGEQGVAASTNSPWHRISASSCVDNSGNLWLFGGSSYGHLNDLWKYDLESGNWTWMTGSAEINQYGVYGTLGVEAIDNTPGARQGAVSWNDKAGNFWLFGGEGRSVSTHGSLNDLWKYNFGTGRWSWMKGSNRALRSGVYGTQGVAASENTPGARRNPASWSDAAGNLWLFGGHGWDLISNGPRNDLWKFDLVAGNWTWIKGSNDVNQRAIYGTHGAASEANTPGARRYATASRVDNKVFLFGGIGWGFGEGYLNELWALHLEESAPEDPTVIGGSFVSSQSLRVTFSEAMSGAVLLPTNYSISGAGQGSLTTTPTSVLWIEGNTYELRWNKGSLAGKRTLTVTISPALVDSTGAAMGTPNSTSIRTGAVAQDREAVPQFVIPEPTGNQNSPFGGTIADAGSKHILVASSVHFGESPVREVYLVNLKTRAIEATYACPQPPPQDTGDHQDFGASMAVWGDKVAIGAPKAEVETAYSSGVVYVFDRKSGNYLYGLSPPEPNTERFGFKVAAEKGVLAVAASGQSVVDTTSSVHIYGPDAQRLRRLQDPNPNGTMNTLFGTGLAISKGKLLITAPNGDADSTGSRGTVYLYDLKKDQYALTVNSPDPVPQLGWFGASGTFAGNDLLIADPGTETSYRRGAAYLVHSKTGQIKTHFLQPPGYDYDVDFAKHIEPLGKHVAVGSYLSRHAGPTTSGGIVYLLHRKTGLELGAIKTEVPLDGHDPLHTIKKFLFLGLPKLQPAEVRVYKPEL